MKISLDSIISGFKSVTTLVSNFGKIQTDLNDKVLYRDNPEGEPNQMENLLDMNGYAIINQSNPVTVDGFNWEGDYSGATTYSVGDAVQYNGTAYIAIAESTGQTPPNATYWQVVVTANLPTQTGNQDKPLTTDGSVASWGSVHADYVDFTSSGTGGSERTLQAKLEDTVSVEDFGAVGDGVTDDTAAIKNAIAAFGYVYGTRGKTYKITSEITINAGIKEGFNLNGSTVDCDAITGNAFLITGTGAEQQYTSKLFNTISNGVIYGLASTGNAIKFDDTASKGSTFESLHIVGFAHQVVWGDNTWTTSFFKCKFRGGSDYQLWYPAGLTNQGERHSFIDCDFFNGVGAVKIESYTLPHFQGCSFDYFNNSNFIYNSVGAVLFLNDCHIEASVEFPWIKNEGSNTTTIITNTLFGTTDTSSLKDTVDYLVDYDTTNYRALVDFNSSTMNFGNFSFDLYKRGLSVISNITANELCTPYLYSISNDTFDGFTGGEGLDSDTAGWGLTNSGGSYIPILVADPYIGTYALEVKSDGGWTSYADMNVPVTPGKYLSLSAFCKGQLGEKVFNGRVTYYSSSGEQIKTSSFSTTSVVATYQRYTYSPATSVPMGAAYARLRFVGSPGFNYLIDKVQVSMC